MKYIAVAALALFSAACELLALVVKGAACAVGAVYVLAHYGVI